MSRPKDFANEDFVEGDVIGLEICLPSLSLHRKVVEGTYNKAVDISDDLDPMAAHEYLDIIRDRVPIRFKNTLYFGKQSLRMTLGCLYSNLSKHQNTGHVFHELFLRFPSSTFRRDTGVLKKGG